MARNDSKWLAVLLFCGTAACGGGGSPTDPPPPPPARVGSATFTLSGGGYSGTESYELASGGLVFCRPNGTLWWIRLAAQTAGDGEAGRHVDIDVCNYAGGGLYTAKDPEAACASTPTWVFWWHDGPGTTFVSHSSSSPCELALSQAAGILEGNFSCRGVREQGGGRTLDVLAGRFRCSL